MKIILEDTLPEAYQEVTMVALFTDKDEAVNTMKELAYLNGAFKVQTRIKSIN